MFALDANAIIHAFQGKGGVAARLSAVSPKSIAIPAIALFEVEQGVLRSQHPVLRRKQLDELVKVCRVLPFDERSASLGAGVQVDLEKLGLKIGPMDTLIAATVIVHGAILVTHNTREFGRVPGLKIEDWF